MTGSQLPVPYSGAVDPMAALAAWMDSVERRLEHAEARAVGPAQGYSWAVDSENQPAIVDGEGNLSPLSAAAVAALTERVDQLEEDVKGPVPGWVWVPDGPRTFAVRAPGGYVFRVALRDVNVQAPMVALGDGNTTDSSTGLSRVPWFDVIWSPPNAQNLAATGHGWVISPLLVTDADSIAPSGATVFLSAGMDDLQGGASTAAIQSAMTTTVRALNQRGLDVYVCTIFPIAVGSVFSAPQYATRNGQRVTLNNYIKSTFTLSGAMALDLAAAVESVADGPLDPAYDSGDGRYLNQDGQASAANAARQILRL